MSVGGRGRRCAVAATVAIGLLAFMPGAHAAAYTQDLRSPDTQEAAAASAGVRAQDLRAPDAQDAAAAFAGVSAQDLRSPDARDAGRRAPPPARAASNDSSWVDWPYVAIGGVALVFAVGVGAATRRRRHRAVRVVATH
jgi:hypothetical protein